MPELTRHLFVIYGDVHADGPTAAEATRRAYLARQPCWQTGASDAIAGYTVEVTLRFEAGPPGDGDRRRAEVQALLDDLIHGHPCPVCGATT